MLFIVKLVTVFYAISEVSTYGLRTETSRIKWFLPCSEAYKFPLNTPTYVAMSYVRYHANIHTCKSLLKLLMVSLSLVDSTSPLLTSSISCCLVHSLLALLDHRNTNQLKVRTSGYGNLQTMNTDKWASSKSTQLSTKIWVKLLLLLENALKLNFEAL